MLYQVYDWVTWRVIINRTTWLNTNDIISCHCCFGKETVLLLWSPVNQIPLYSITVNSAISAENTGGGAICTATSLPLSALQHRADLHPSCYLRLPWVRGLQEAPQHLLSAHFFFQRSQSVQGGGMGWAPSITHGKGKRCSAHTLANDTVRLNHSQEKKPSDLFLEESFEFQDQ